VIDPNIFVDEPMGKEAMDMYVQIASLNHYVTAPREKFYFPQT
jgi:hypothetical protein